MSSESLPARKSRPQAYAQDVRGRRPGARPLVLRLADWSLVAAFLALTFLLGVFPLKDTDFWWHLRTGDLIRQTGQVPRTDIYTFTLPPGSPWIDLHWGFQVALSWGYAHGGVVGLNLAKCAITCAAMLLLVTARRRDWPVWAMLLAWLPALLVLSGRMYVRPETLSLLFLACYLAILFRWDRSPWLALALPVVQVVWVNVQGLFVLGPIVLSFALLDAALRPGSFAPGRRRWWRIVGLATLLTGLACLVNPYGLTGALYPLAARPDDAQPDLLAVDRRADADPAVHPAVGRPGQPPAPPPPGDDGPRRPELPGPDGLGGRRPAPASDRRGRAREGHEARGEAGRSEGGGKPTRGVGRRKRRATTRPGAARDGA